MRKKKELSAYMTTEVSLLFPVILLLLVIILYLIFFKYNQVIIFQNAFITALYGTDCAYEDEKKEDLVGRMYEVLKKINSNQYLAISSLEQKVIIEKNNINVIQNTSMKIPFFSEEISNEMIISEKAVVEIKNYIFYMRQIRKVRGENG